MNRFSRPSGDCVIECEEGKQGSEYLKQLIKTSPLVYPGFIGNCFCCGYLRHSSSFCPLKKCRFCKEHGHIEKSCGKKLGTK